MTLVAEQIGEWLTEFTRQPSVEPALQQLREDAFRVFSEAGFPTTHDEEWRFTNVAPIARTTFRVAVSEPRVRIPGGVQKLGRAEAPLHLAKHASDRNPFVALNTAFLGNVTVLKVPKGAVIESPIEITHEAVAADVPLGVHPRTLILVGADAQCSIIERYHGPGGVYFTNAVTEIVAADSAVVDHYKVQLEGPAAFHVATLQATLGRSANLTTTSIDFGGLLVRNDVNVTLSEGTETTLNGLYVVNRTQHVDNHTAIDHAKPHGTSHELYKGVLDDRSSAVFNGQVLVRKDAQKTDSKQTNKNLVLSDSAVIDTKPELQIFADDVRCTHGATIGQLDAESLFYLQSRGIGKNEARGLLTRAFAQDVLDRIKVQDLRESLERILFEKYHERVE